MEIVDCGEEFIEGKLRQVGGEGVEVLDVAVHHAVLNRERLFGWIAVKGELRGNGGGGRYVHQKVLYRQRSCQTGYFVTIAVFFLQ